MTNIEPAGVSNRAGIPRRIRYGVYDCFRIADLYNPCTYMICDHQVYPELALGIIRLRGTVNASIIAECIVTLHSDDHWRSDFKTLWDGREIGALVVIPGDVRMILSLTEILLDGNAPGKIAAVASTQVHADIANLFAAKGRALPCRMRSFATLEQALNWLGLEELPAGTA